MRIPDRRVLVGRFAAALLVVGTLAAGLSWAVQRWKLAVDQSEYPCVGARLFLVSVGEVSTVPGSIITFRTRGIPLFDDGTLFTKRVLAGPGETVHVVHNGVSVAGHTLPYTRYALERLARTGWKVQPPGGYTVPPGHVFVAGDHPRSFDSRYYGPVPVAQILGTARPIW